MVFTEIRNKLWKLKNIFKEKGSRYTFKYWIWWDNKYNHFFIRASKNIRVRTLDDKFGEDLMCENFGQRGLRTVYWRTPSLAVWRPMRSQRRVLRTTSSAPSVCMATPLCVSQDTCDIVHQFWMSHLPTCYPPWVGEVAACNSNFLLIMIGLLDFTGILRLISVEI